MSIIAQIEVKAKDNASLKTRRKITRVNRRSKEFFRTDKTNNIKKLSKRKQINKSVKKEKREIINKFNQLR